jgi:CDGSH-type Zn-finger protein/uncharacterized Fe-S cluster protein YjdI
MGNEIEEVRAPHLLLRFETKKCIHSRNCVLARPDVFVPNVRGEWLHPERATLEEIAALAQACPSGAIRYERTDGGPDEAAPRVNAVRVRENGPNAFAANMQIVGHGPALRATLCRCGASQNKPFCNGGHTAAGFTATGEPAAAEMVTLEARDGEVVVEPVVDGPLRVTGNLEICAGTGHTIAKLTKALLCRCGCTRRGAPLANAARAARRNAEGLAERARPPRLSSRTGRPAWTSGRELFVEALRSLRPIRPPL